MFSEAVSINSSSNNNQSSIWQLTMFSYSSYSKTENNNYRQISDLNWLHSRPNTGANSNV